MNLYDHRDAVTALLQARLGQEGTTIRDARYGLMIGKKDTIEIHRETIGHEIGPVTMHLTSTNSAHNRNAIDRFVTRGFALKAREKALEDQIDNDVIPPWSLLIHPLLKTLLHHLAIPLSDVTKLARSGSGYVVNKYGFACMQMKTVYVAINGQKHSVRLRIAGINAGVLKMELLIAAEEIVITSDTAGPVVSLAGHTLPETLLLAVPNRTFDEIVSHPLLLGSGAIVSKAIGAGPDTLELRLKNELVSLDPVPDGINTQWIDALKKGKH